MIIEERDHICEPPDVLLLHRREHRNQLSFENFFLPFDGKFSIVGFFAARCTPLVKARIHSQVLSFIFPCASRYKVGNPTNYAGSRPVAVGNQIEAYSGLLVGLLMMVTYILVLVLISPWLLLVVAAMGGMVIFLQGKFLPRLAAGSRQLTQPKSM